MWSGPLHDTGFCERLLGVVNEEPTRFRTAARIRGMVGTAMQELGNAHAPAPGSKEDADAAEVRESGGGDDQQGGAQAPAKAKSEKQKKPPKGKGKADEGESAAEDEAEGSGSGNGLQQPRGDPAADTMFYFTAARIAGGFHRECPPMSVYINALLNAGYKVSRSHCARGSLKTDCPRHLLMDIQRCWLKENEKEQEQKAEAAAAAGGDAGGEKKEAKEETPANLVRMSKRIAKLGDGSPAKQLHLKPIVKFWDIKTVHPDTKRLMSLEDDFHADEEAADAAAAGEDGAAGGGAGTKRKKLARYPENPAANWGPGTAARQAKGPKKAVKEPTQPRQQKVQLPVKEKETTPAAPVAAAKAEGGADEEDEDAIANKRVKLDA